MQQFDSNKDFNDNERPVLRPYFLTLLCVLTLISSCLSVFSYSFYSINFNMLQEMLKANQIPVQLSWMKDSMEMLLNAGIGFFILSAIFNLSAIIGALFMWNMKRIGFHIYTISQILLIITTQYYIYHQSLPWAEILGSGLYVGLYGTQLRFMR